MKKMQIRMQLVCLFSMLLLFFPVELFAQQGTITGKVVDERGESVIGATVMVKGSTDGTITDLDGNFKINGKVGTDRKSTRLNSSHRSQSRMPSSA